VRMQVAACWLSTVFFLSHHKSTPLSLVQRISRTSSQNILLLKSIWTERNGINSRTSRQRLQSLLYGRPFKFPSTFQISIVAYTPETGTPTRILQKFSIQSFKSIMESNRQQFILLIWIQIRSLEMLVPMFQFTLFVLELADQLMDLVFHQESQENREKE